jgi:hypothetical protein
MVAARLPARDTPMRSQSITLSNRAANLRRSGRTSAAGRKALATTTRLHPAWRGDGKVTVSSPAGRLLTRDAVDSHLRLPGPASLGRDCLMTLIVLVFQFGLGMILNLFIPVPPADEHAGFIKEVRTAPLGLTLHALLGTLLICAAIVLVTGAIRAKDRLMIAFAATGLVAIIGAFAAGELFVRDGRNGVSLSMALLTGVALVSYASALARAKASSA